MVVRSPIIAVLGHVDHGKTSVLDFIRGTAVASKEAGLITQHIGATEVPLDTIKNICGNLLDTFKIKFTIPGLLFIDTPGHEAFTNLRKRGGSIADLAVLVIDINQGIQPQTAEAINILKTFKVPFIIAANKIDILSGWKSVSKIAIQNIEKQSPETKKTFETKFYNLLAQLSEYGFDSDLYNRIDDYKQKIAIIPTSAKTGEGIPELLAMIAGLTQKFLGKRLVAELSKNAKGTILEIKEEKGMGTTADVIIYDGILKKNDTIIIGGIDEVIETKVRALLKPLPLVEIREKGAKFEKINEVAAATGVKILAPELDRTIAGSPFRSARNSKEIKEAKSQILEEIEEVLIETEEEGIIVKADTLGSLEAISNLFKEKGIKIKSANIGDINKKDISEAISSMAKDQLYGFVLGFNVNINEDISKIAKDSNVNVIIDQVIYKLIEKYEEALENKKKELELKSLEGLVWPAKIRIIPGYVFRQSNPAIFGVEVLSGKLTPKVEIMNSEGKNIGEIKTIEDSGEKLQELTSGHQAAISVPGLTLGRQAKEGDIIYVDMPEDSFKLMKTTAKKFLSKSDIELLKEIAEIKRKDNEIWGL